jgi:hypothetical protein
VTSDCGKWTTKNRKNTNSLLSRRVIRYETVRGKEGGREGGGVQFILTKEHT